MDVVLSLGFDAFLYSLQADDGQDFSGVMADPDFLKKVLSTLPGVDPSSEAIEKVMESLAKQDSEDSKQKDEDEPMDEGSSKEKKEDKK